MALTLQVQQVYPADPAAIHWRGIQILDADEFDLFLRGPVRARVTDSQFEADLAADLQALATTDMATDTLAKLLGASTPPLSWEIGEAMAECLLHDEEGVCWPWNENRDRKTPRASLPGADLVGFYGEGDATVFLFGEVKTSSDQNNPPGVMNGRSGVAHQIDTLATSVEIQFTLLKWLAARCRHTELWDKFRVASTRYLESGGKDVALVGVLLRDTPAHVEDLRSRGQALGEAGIELPKIRLDAWYAPRPIVDWVAQVMAET